MFFQDRIAIGPARVDLSDGGGAAAAEWYKTITVESDEVTANLTDFPILVSLASDSDLASRADALGQDIYITENDGTTQVPHEIEYYDSSTGELVLWFKGDISASVDTVFRIYYGSGTLPSDAGSVWDTNYEGVYHFDPDVASKAIAQNGIAQAIHPPNIAPMAYYYNGVTYVVWQGDSGLDPYITTYTHSTETWATPVKIASNPLSNDDHGAPAVIVDDSGYIHVFFGSHNTAILHSKSDSAEDISAWTAQSNLPVGTYPNALKISGTIYVFYRSGSDPWGYTYVTDSDYSTETDIIDNTSDHIPYLGQLVYDSTNSRIHMAWYINNGSSQYFDVAHAYLDLGDNHLYTMGGTDLGTSISETEMDNNCIIVNSSTDQTWIPSIRLDGSNNPHVIYPIESGSGFKYQYIYWNGSAWSTPEDITTSTGVVTTIGNFYFNGSDIEAYLVTDPTNATYGRSGNLEHWRLSGGSWSEVRTVFGLTDSYPYYGGAGNPQIVQEGVDALRVIFADLSVENYSRTDLEIFALSSEDFYLGRNLTVGNFATTKTILDSTTNVNHASGPEPTGVSAKAGQGSTLDGSGDRYNPDIIPGAFGYTVEVWINADAIPTGGADIYSQGNNNNNVPYIRAILRDIDTGDGNGQIKRMGFVHQDNDGAGDYSEYGQTTLSISTWYHLVWDYSSNGAVIMYVNGQAESQDVYQAGTPSSTTLDTDQIAALRRSSPSNYFGGSIDEVRISSSSRSADWIETSYNNQNAPGTFITLGSEMEA